MRRLKWALLWLVLGSAVGYGVYIARLSYSGYCFAEGRYLSDAEKVRVAVADVLKKYPPSVELRKHHPDAKIVGYLPPEKPIFYRDVDEFLALNPGCCAITLRRKELEDSGARFEDKLTGTVSSFVGMDYWVLYWDDDNKEQAIKTEGYLPLSNCGKPVRWWTGLESYSEFIYRSIKHRGTS